MAPNLGDYLRLARPHFLLAGLGLFTLSAAAALSRGLPMDVTAYLLGQLTVSSLQLMTHLANERWDLEGDRWVDNRSLLTGGSGVLQEGRVPPAHALNGARLLLVVGLLSAALLSLRQATGWPLAVGLSGAFLGWSYSTPPLRLSARGLGEPATAVVVGLLVPAMAFASLGGRPEPVVWLAGAPLALLMAAAMITIELPDVRADTRSGKRTWVVRLGRRGAWRTYRLLLLAAAGTLVGLAAGGWLPAASLTGLAGLLPWPLAERLAGRDPEDPRLSALGLAGVALGAAGVFGGLLLMGRAAGPPG